MNVNELFDKNYFDHSEYISPTNRFFYKFLSNHLSHMERYMNKLSIIIQGPLHNRSINTIDNYLEYGEVIVSCWDTDDLSRLDRYKDDIKIVINKYSDISIKKRQSGSQAPWIYQNYTTLNGLKAAKGYFCIKVRSDESYPLLDPLINKLKHYRDTKDPQTNKYQEHKIITSNIYFRYDWQNKFHPSDHIIAGTRKRMIESFELSNFYCRFNLTKFPEQLICKAIINSYFDPITQRKDIAKESKSIELMKKHFDIIRISALPNHVWTSSYRKYDALYSEEDWCHDINSIKINT